jgi:hypothetical protein
MSHECKLCRGIMSRACPRCCPDDSEQIPVTVAPPVELPPGEQRHQLGVSVPFKPFVMNTTRGPVLVEDAPGGMVGVMDSKNPDLRRVVFVTYHPPKEGKKMGTGEAHQMDADATRAMAASLLRMADRIDPRKPN